MEDDEWRYTLTAAPTIRGYADLSAIGRGGFSTVYSALQTDLNRRVAIKVLNVDVTDESARHRFERECKVVGMLSGIDGIVPVFQSLFTTEGRPCIVMQLMEHGSLDTFVKENGPLSNEDGLSCALQLAFALNEAHIRGVAHRDIKPGNVLINNDRVALADFGIAIVEHLAASTHTVESLSPPYAAPERLIGGEPDEQRCDIYALGATLYFCLVGRPPFGTSKDGGVSGLIHRVLHEAPPPIERLDVDSEFVSLIGEMLAKRPDERPETISAVLERLKAIDRRLQSEALQMSAQATQPTAQEPVEEIDDTEASFEGSIAIPAPSSSSTDQLSWLLNDLGSTSAPALSGLSDLDDLHDQDDGHTVDAAVYNSAAQEAIQEAQPLVAPSAATASVATTTATPDQWPTAVDYVQAIQDSATIQVDELRAGEVERDFLGMPMSAAGQSAIVFQFDTPTGPIAARFFTRAPGDGIKRYLALHNHLQKNPCSHIVTTQWVDTAIVVNDVPYPGVLMPWVPGRPLNLVVEDLIHDPVRLEVLAEILRDAFIALESSGIDHGDLQNGNILVSDDLDVWFVDLDGVHVPAAGLSAPDETGHRCFQHPRRTSAHWVNGIDTFSAVVIYTSLMALAADPGLWRFHEGENLILNLDDFQSPDTSEALHELLTSPSRLVQSLSAELKGYLETPAPPVIGFTTVAEQFAHLVDLTVSRNTKPVEVPQSQELPSITAIEPTEFVPDFSDIVTTPSAPTPVNSTPTSTADWWDVHSAPHTSEPMHASIWAWWGKTPLISAFAVSLLAGLAAIAVLVTPGIGAFHSASGVGVELLAAIIVTAMLAPCWQFFTGGSHAKARELIVPAFWRLSLFLFPWLILGIGSESDFISSEFYFRWDEFNRGLDPYNYIWPEWPEEPFYFFPANFIFLSLLFLTFNLVMGSIFGARVAFKAAGVSLLFAFVAAFSFPDHFVGVAFFGAAGIWSPFVISFGLCFPFLWMAYRSAPVQVNVVSGYLEGRKIGLYDNPVTVGPGRTSHLKIADSSEMHEDNPIEVHLINSEVHVVAPPPANSPSGVAPPVLKFSAVDPVRVQFESEVFKVMTKEARRGKK